MRDPLVSTFGRLEIYKGLLTSAINATERGKQEANRQLMETSSIGFRNIHNQCDQCEQDLLPVEKLDSYIRRVQNENEDLMTNEMAKYEDSFFSKVYTQISDLTGTGQDEASHRR